MAEHLPSEEIVPAAPDPGCAKCGSSMYWVDCWSCGGEGWHELYDDDPLYYDEDDRERCDECRGKGGWKACMSCSPGQFDE